MRVNKLDYLTSRKTRLPERIWVYWVLIQTSPELEVFYEAS